MSFHTTAQNIELDGTKLKAELKNTGGDYNEVELDLNDVLGNNNGSFEWGANNFGNSAKDITFSLEGGDEVPVLRAILTNRDKEGVPADVNLSERIYNRDGSFHFE